MADLAEQFEFEQSLDEWARIDAQMDGAELMLKRITHPTHSTPINDRLLSMDIWAGFDRDHRCGFCGHEHDNTQPEWRLPN